MNLLSILAAFYTVLPGEYISIPKYFKINDIDQFKWARNPRPSKLITQPDSYPEEVFDYFPP